MISALAKQFAVCDHWFASAPCQTWPNRWFVHTATADGHENNEPIHVLDVDTIYNRCELAGTVDWKIYFHDFAQSMTLLKLWPLTEFVPRRIRTTMTARPQLAKRCTQKAGPGPAA